MPIAGALRARSHWSATGGSGRRELVGPGARRPASDRKARMALVERGWLQMNLRSRLLPALGAGAVVACLLGSAPNALAGTPAAVTVRLEGLSETKLPATPVTTTTTPVVKDGKAED